MPRNVRNFWIELDVDGKQSSIATGPRTKDGGFTMTILMREEGQISDKCMEVRGDVNGAGELILEAKVWDGLGLQSTEIQTKR